MEISKIIQQGQALDGGEWYTISGTDVQVKIQPVSPSKMRGIRSKCYVRKMVGHRIEEVFDSNILNEMILDICVTDWKGIVMDGQPLPVTKENKKLLDDNWIEFSSLWNTVITSDAETRAAMQEDERKN